MDKYKATPQELEAQIKMCTKEVLPKLLLAVISQSIKLDVFGDKPLHKIVETFEGTLKGWKR